MISINTGTLKNQINSLSSLISSYEEIKLNLFHQLEDSNVNWQDGHAILFGNEIAQEKKETELLFQSLQDKKNVCTFIYDRYSEIGGQVRCELSKKDQILGQVTSCINQTNQILSNFNRIDDSFYYYEYNVIMNQKSKIEYARDLLYEVAETLRNLYTKIERIELEVKNKIDELEQIRMNAFDFHLN